MILWVALQTERGVTDFRDNLLALPWEFGDPGVRLGGSTQDRLSLPRIFKVVLKSTGARGAGHPLQIARCQRVVGLSPDQHVRLWWLPLA